MRNRKRWVIIDVETDGLYDPIHVVELAGQLMEGWEPVGEPFRMLLNHDVPIPPVAVEIHGYTQEYLRDHGQDPRYVYAAFSDYARDYPLVAHNLSYDWNRSLEPEWARIGISPIGQRGFCCMMLARRLVTETKSYRLDVLKECFRLSPSESHRAKNDVLAIVELFNKVYQPRLESCGLYTFDSVVEFSKQTPVAKCLHMIRRGVKSEPPAPVLQDEWYYLDAASNAHGPFPACDINERAGLEMFYVYREGMADWAVNRECSEFLALSDVRADVARPVRRYDAAKSAAELVGVCRGIIADDKITTAEVMFLNSWLEDAGCITEWPASEIAQTVERILEDGKVTKAEKDELKHLIQAISAPTADDPVGSTDQGVTEILPIVAPVKGNGYYTVVELEQGSREWREWRHRGIGASDAPVIMGENPWNDVTALLREKSGPLRSHRQNAAMARGTELEPEARRRYIAATGKEVRPACLQSRQYGWLRASVDGLSLSGEAVVEIKCGNSVYRTAAETQCVPDYYYGQLQHILAVTGLSSIDFWCYLPGRPEVLLSVARDATYIDDLIRAELEFWNCVKRAG